MCVVAFALLCSCIGILQLSLANENKDHFQSTQYQPDNITDTVTVRAVSFSLQTQNYCKLNQTEISRIKSKSNQIKSKQSRRKQQPKEK